MSYEECISISGFMLLPILGRDGYYGVGRFPFEPEYPAELQIYGADPEERPKPWHFYPPGWKRDAYRLYEEHCVQDCDSQIFLVSNFEVAIEIKNIIEPNIGLYEIMEIEASHLDILASIDTDSSTNNLGYDVAYLGGDLNSAIYRYIDLYPTLSEYKPKLNQWGLFPKPDIIPSYLRLFRETIHSEANSEFHIFKLSRTTK